MKNDLFIKDEDVDSFLHAIIFMSNVALGKTTQVDYFTDEEIKGFKVLCKFLFPLVQKIHEETNKSLNSLLEDKK
jgi:hypothetical protein